MLDPADNSVLPAIPAKRYFTIGEVSELCQVKPHVLRYWEQEFSQLNPVKRRGNRRYYQRHEVELIRTIRSLLYLEGFTISGARQKLESEDEFEETVMESAEQPKVSREVIGGLINELEELTVMLRD
ncbi:MAG: MerR family transcriptional regulator [Gammaproteobacteria bacterium]|nr:MerR family transcriptional regulator [Gammaproteobacteria bacterium]